jgi:hypothetical protein
MCWANSHKAKIILFLFIYVLAQQPKGQLQSEHK